MTLSAWSISVKKKKGPFSLFKSEMGHTGVHAGAVFHIIPYVLSYIFSKLLNSTNSLKLSVSAYLMFEKYVMHNSI